MIQRNNLVMNSVRNQSVLHMIIWELSIDLFKLFIHKYSSQKFNKTIYCNNSEWGWKIDGSVIFLILSWKKVYCCTKYPETAD